jgi:hypothetical protein
MDGICVISPAVIASISIRPKRASVTIAGDPGKDVPTGTLKSILKQLQTMRLMREAIDIHLTEMRRDGEPIPSRPHCAIMSISNSERHYGQPGFGGGSISFKPLLRD